MTEFDGVALGKGRPRIRFGLLQSERNPPVFQIHIEYDGFDVLAELEHLRRMLHALAPRHLGNVNQAFDTRRELDKSAVVGNVHNLAGDARAREVLIRNQRPRIGLQLLVAERNAFLLAVVLENLDGDLVADIEQFRRMVDAAPGKIGHMKQAVDSAEIDEHAVVGDVLDGSPNFRIFPQNFKSESLSARVLALDNTLARQHDVAPLAVQLDDAAFDFFALQRVEIL